MATSLVKWADFFGVDPDIPSKQVEADWFADPGVLPDALKGCSRTSFL